MENQAAQADHSTPEKILRDLLGGYHLELNGVVAHAPFFGSGDDGDLQPNERCDDHLKEDFVNSVLWALDHLPEATESNNDLESQAKAETVPKASSVVEVSNGTE